MTDVSRRNFLVSGSLWGAGLWIAAQLPKPAAQAAAAESSEPATFTADEWKTVEAMTARILPTDHEPGAREANCVNFIDKALAHEDAAAVPLYRLGLPVLNGEAEKRHGTAFHALDVDQQDELLTRFEANQVDLWPSGAPVPPAVFFETVRVQTILGFLADPKYGGNRDYAGWKVSRYPGPRHHRGGYSAEQLAGTAPVKPIWEHEH
ncbi:MAG: gluconate 2-dehydrogenase subunit 3 family protein [Myxococcota bacterium]